MLYFLLFSLFSGCSAPMPLFNLHTDTRILMGTFIEVTSPDSRAAEIVFKEIKRIEGLLSIYDLSSDISQLNENGVLRASPETYDVMKKAGEIWEASEGAFDITVGPLIDLWGFTFKQYTLPSVEAIKATLTKVGYDKLLFNDKERVIEFGVPGMKIDLGGIGKGYALDCAAKKLKERGISNCLINAGGQVYALGYRSGGSQPWVVAVQDPRSQRTLRNFPLPSGYSASTSGDYEQYFIQDNKRYSHIIDPKTGFPAKSGVVSVTVVAPDGTTADALSTAILVLGKEKGAELARKFTGVTIEDINTE